MLVDICQTPRDILTLMHSVNIEEVNLDAPLATEQYGSGSYLTKDGIFFLPRVSGALSGVLT